MTTRTPGILIVVLVLLLAWAGRGAAQTYDISSGGLPTITGHLGGSVIGSASTATNLAVTINFGEVSPSNTNGIVKVIVPIMVRSLAPYQVTASVSGPININPQAIQRSDIGFGAENMRGMGLLARNCNNSDHIFYAPFNNDPADNVTLAPSGRAVYPGTINNLTGTPVILSGPVLSWFSVSRALTTNGYIFDAIFTITPQFYAGGTSASATVTFTISAGPNVPC